MAFFESLISTINNGMDLAAFTPVEKAVKNTIVIGMQSRIIAIKDHGTLLAAFALAKQQHPELMLQLKIAGNVLC